MFWMTFFVAKGSEDGSVLCVMVYHDESSTVQI